MFRLTAFPASDGDCLLLSWGDRAPYRHVLIDGGRKRAYASLRPVLERIAAAGEAIDLLVLSHIDADHIEGLLALIRDPRPPVTVREVWYNGFDQMNQIEQLGPRQGDLFSTALKAIGWPWNRAFDGKPVVLDGRQPKRLSLAGLDLILVSPDAGKLRRMREAWLKWRTVQAAKASAEERRRAALPAGIEELGPRPMPPVLDVEALAAVDSAADDEPPNGSSIAFVAQWGQKRVLLAGDAHPDLLETTLAPLAAGEGGRYRIDLFKVSHHGSRGNTSRRLIELLDCRRFLISTNGSHHGHPDPEAIAQLVKFAPAGEKTLYFNYESAWTTPWDDPALRRRYDYRAIYPTGAPGELSIDV
ncbi:MAG TPA: MBL fold metallo-hydrolase [Allosphingosinicella sp.]|nr:MBL fold metallo-hydrolase [Allosphingosinicella sp.]